MDENIAKEIKQAMKDELNCTETIDWELFTDEEIALLGMANGMLISNLVGGLKDYEDEKEKSETMNTLLKLGVINQKLKKMLGI